MSNSEMVRGWPKTLGESFFTDLVPTKAATKSVESSAQSISFSPEKIKGILDKAYLNGFDRGVKNGHEAGMKQAHEQLAHEKETLLHLINTFSLTAQEKSQVLCEDILALALEVAKAMLKQQLKVRPEVILPILQQATGSIIDVKEPLHLLLHPEDAEIARRYLEPELKHWNIQENHQIERGGCLIETANNTVDASNSNRWNLICAALGQNNDWLIDPVAKAEVLGKNTAAQTDTEAEIDLDLAPSEPELAPSPPTAEED
jgi:flagellar assembly protein FliH